MQQSGVEIEEECPTSSPVQEWFLFIYLILFI